jgi:hypothetical protein
MRLVNSNSRELLLLVYELESFAEVVTRAELWCDVEQTRPWVAGLKIPLDLLFFWVCCEAVERSSLYSCCLKCFDLVDLC